MNISEHIDKFIQEATRRNYSQNTINNYVSCLKLFFSQSTKDHPKNINMDDIREFLNKFSEPNTQRNYHSAIKMFYNICLNQKNKFKYTPYAKKNSKLPTSSNQDTNRQLKIIGGLAKIDSLVKVGSETRVKYSFITSHTARRSGATNLYLQGVPDKVIMDLGGWRKVETFRSYIRLTRLESANKAMDYAFFK